MALLSGYITGCIGKYVSKSSYNNFFVTIMTNSNTTTAESRVITTEYT